MTQQQVGDLAGVSQTFVSQAERHLGHDASLETWASLGAAVGYQLAAFLELAPGATPPRDMEHLRRQQGVIDTAVPGQWRGTPEFSIRTGDGSQRFIDVYLDRPESNETLVVEIVDLFADVGEDLRGLERKLDAVRALQPLRRVAGLLVVRATTRNRAIISELAALFGSRFSSGPVWLRALEGTVPMPDGDGFLWSDSQSARLTAVRLPRPAPPRSRRSRPRGTAGSDK